MEDKINLRRVVKKIYEDLETGTINISSVNEDGSLIKIGKDILFQPEAGGKLKSMQPMEYIVSGTTNELAGMAPGVPSTTAGPNTFPYYNYIIPITSIAITAASLLINTGKTNA